MNFNQRLLQVAMRDSNVREIKGRQDHPKIELAHRITKIEGLKGGDFTDEIPWCASIMNLWILIAAAELNPGRVYEWLMDRGFESSVCLEVLRLAGYKPGGFQRDTGIEIPQPTWSASALSFKNWGNPVPKDKLQLGDMLCFIRDGGGHVTLFLSSGVFTYTVFGGNQSNAVCSADWYMKSKLVTARRFIV